MIKAALDIFGKEAAFTIHNAFHYANNVPSFLLYGKQFFIGVVNDEVGAVVVEIKDFDDDEFGRDYREDYVLNMTIGALTIFHEALLEDGKLNGAESAECARAILLKQPLNKFSEETVERLDKKPYNPIQVAAIATLKKELAERKAEYSGQVTELRDWSIAEREALEEKIHRRMTELGDKFEADSKEINDRINEIEASASKETRK